MIWASRVPGIVGNKSEQSPKDASAPGTEMSDAIETSRLSRSDRCRWFAKSSAVGG